MNDRSRLIRADEDTIERTLSTINPNPDNSEKLSFQDFLDYLYLFFSSKKNWRVKIVNVLTGHRRSHALKGHLTSREAQSFFDFVVRFYGIRDEEREKSKITFGDLQSYADFAEKIFPLFEERLFVTWL